MDRLLIVSADGDNETRIRQHKAAVDAAVRAGVGFIVYTSVGRADSSSLFLAPVHRATEEFIRESGIPYSFLRNNWYLENEMGTIQAVQAGAPWLTSAGEGKVGWAVRRDYAEAAAAVLAGEGHENTVYELSGAPATQAELAAVVGGVLGKEVPVQQVDDDAYADIMAKAGVPEGALPIVVGIQQAIREGALDITSSDFAKLLQRPLTPLSAGVSDLLGVKA
ncbi:Quinone oxidoreductase 2 [compost metagenome]